MDTMTTPEQRAKNAEYMRGWHARNPEKIKGYNLARYGMSFDDYSAMREAQNQACAICLRPFEDNQRMRAHVDHNHETGKIRGLVCPKCNYILGRVDKDVNILIAAVAYLQRAA
jgi:Recombination endonuclease VII